tara:strand:- start:9240 stop:10763 length:1524 start_codon:yes stop_codon:yes gene_type:complete
MRILQDVSVDGSLTGTSLIKTGGTSSQYLMADGSVTTGGGGNQIIGTDADISYSGATVVSTINMTDGVITSHGSRTLTLANLGYTGATNANNYVHPTYDGDDLSVGSGTLTGATVISSLDLLVRSDTLGHVTEAEGTVATRTLTLANLGYTGATNANYITNNNQLTNGAGYVTLNSQLSNEAVQDIVGAMFIDGTNTTVDYNDSANTIMINASGGGATSPWTADTYGATISGNVGIGTPSNSSLDLYVAGSARVGGVFRVDSELTASTGINLDGNAYIKDQNGTTGSTGNVLTKHALGGVEWAAPTGGGGSGTVTNVTGGTGIDVTSGTTTPNVYLDLNELSAVYTTSGMKNTDAVAIIDSASSRKVYVDDFRRLDTAPSASTASGTIIRMTASGTVTSGYAVCATGTLQVKHANANAGTSLTNPAIGIAVSSASSGQGVDVLIHGIAYWGIFPTFTVGSQVFLDDLAGRLSNTAPLTTGDMVQVMGICIATDKVLINPSSDFMIRS